METIIQNQRFEEERALYALRDASLSGCTFEGDADGESALKESRHVRLHNCRLALRYPLWHAEDFLLSDCHMTDTARAPMWYTDKGTLRHCRLDAPKALRESTDTLIEGSAIRSTEFGWRCRELRIRSTAIESDYLFFESRAMEITGMRMKGKYSFQYVEDMVIRDSVLDTKDAFWHSKNVRVENSTVKGEYLGWFSEGLTLVNCHIVGTQPLCYCKDLTLIDCTMEGTDLSFEYSEVEATVKGEILSVKNPKSGHITADRIGDVVYEGSILTSACEITQRKLCVFS